MRGFHRSAAAGERNLMAPKSKVVVSTAPAMYRPSSNERRAARLAEIAGKQGELKREAAERRAKREREAGPNGTEPAAQVPHTTASTSRANTR